ncbi:Arc family DNA-binding protein [Massilia sp. CCM 9206]|nr:Arc family DNA-binding protein [Massilia sp. CCM 9206]
MQVELRSQLELAAVSSGRSMNAEIVHRLENSFSSSQSSPTDAGAAANRGIARLEVELLAGKLDLILLTSAFEEAIKCLPVEVVESNTPFKSQLKMLRKHTARYAISDEDAARLNREHAAKLNAVLTEITAEIAGSQGS